MFLRFITYHLYFGGSHANHLASFFDKSWKMHAYGNAISRTIAKLSYDLRTLCTRGSEYQTTDDAYIPAVR